MEKTMTDGSKDLKQRTKDFALRIIRLYCALPTTTKAQVLGKTILKSGQSVGAHYREGMRARSNAEFISKLEGGLQELEETRYWLELLGESGIVEPEKLAGLNQETAELNAMLTASVKTVKQRK